MKDRLPQQVSSVAVPTGIDIRQFKDQWHLEWPAGMQEGIWIRAEFPLYFSSSKSHSYAELSFALWCERCSKIQAIYLVVRDSEGSKESAFELSTDTTSNGDWSSFRYLVKLDEGTDSSEYFLGIQSNCRLRAALADLSFSVHSSLPLNYKMPHAPKSTGTPTRSVSETGLGNYRIAIVVCVHNSLSVSLACLRSVIETVSSDVLIVVIDDGSTMEVGDQLKQLLNQTANGVYICDRTGSGYTQAVNRGVASVEADFYVLLNSDAIVPPDWLSRILSPFLERTRANLGIVGPFSNRATIQSVPMVFHESGWADNHSITPSNFAAYDVVLRTIAEHLDLPPIPVRVVNGFCMAVSRDVFETIGLFDARFFSTGYGEETDFQMRAAIAGFSCLVIPNLLVFHHGSSSYEKYEVRAYQDAAYKLVSLKYGKPAIVDAYNNSKDSLLGFPGRDIVSSLLKADSILGIDHLDDVGKGRVAVEEIVRRAVAVLGFLAPRKVK